MTDVEGFERLSRIAKALDVDVSALFAEKGADSELVRALLVLAAHPGSIGSETRTALIELAARVVQQRDGRSAALGDAQVPDKPKDC